MDKAFLTGIKELRRRGVSEDAVTRILRIAMALLVAAFAVTACAGQSDEERCKGGGGIWKSDSCEYSGR